MKRPSFLRLDRAELFGVGSVIVCLVVCVLVDVLSLRHYARWDVTRDRRYTLSGATRETLHGLPEPVKVWVMLGSADPLATSMRQLLVAYAAETSRLDVRWVDPDRDVAQMEDLKKRFRIESGRAEDGRLVTDAVVVVERGERHWFVASSDLFALSEEDDGRVRPKEEEAMTRALRAVVSGDKARLCFVQGHGEMAVSDHGDQGLGHLADVLEKDNFVVESRALDAPGGVTGGTPGKAPLDGCAAAVLAGPREPLPEADAERLRTWLLAGGSLLVAVSPLAGDGPRDDTGLRSPGLERVLTPFGVVLDEDLVLEDDAERVLAGSLGIGFRAEVRPHPVTVGLDGPDAAQRPKVLATFARSLRRGGDPEAHAVELLATSPQAYGVTRLADAAEWSTAPRRTERDLAGPLVVAVASERPKVDPAASRGPRVVALGSASFLTRAAFGEPLARRGAALLAENALAWLAARPQVLDVPAKAHVAAGLRLTDDTRDAIRRYVLFYVPGATLLLGVAVAARRRATERRDAPSPDGRGAGRGPRSEGRPAKDGPRAAKGKSKRKRP